MTKAMPFLQKYDITFLRPPTIAEGLLLVLATKDDPRLCRGFDLSPNAPCFCMVLDSIHRGARPACVALA